MCDSSLCVSVMCVYVSVCHVCLFVCRSVCLSLPRFFSLGLTSTDTSDGLLGTGVEGVGGGGGGE